jgi:hypothetical protein
VPFALHVVSGDAVARIRGWGREEFASAMEAMRRLGTDPRLAPGAPILMDVRELDYLATPPEIDSFAQPEAVPSFFSSHRVAIIVRRGTQDAVGRAFASRARQAGSDFRVFVEEDAGMAWLTGGE